MFAESGRQSEGWDEAYLDVAHDCTQSICECGYTKAITERDAFSPNLEWDAESEAAWCPMIGHTYLRNVQGLCTVLPRIKIGV